MTTVCLDNREGMNPPQKHLVMIKKRKKREILTVFVKDIESHVRSDSDHSCRKNFSRVILFDCWRKVSPDKSVVRDVIHSTIDEDFFLRDGKDGIFGRSCKRRNRYTT
jgi:hypothetical protein